MRVLLICVLLTTFISVSTTQIMARSFSTDEAAQQDTIKENQTLYNGKIWRNLYNLVQEDQFLFSKEFLNGSVTISGKTFLNIPLKYDIYKDEVLTPVNPGGVLQLNKELIDSFSLTFQNRNYQFIKFEEDSAKGTRSFFNVIYKGETSLLLRYSKKIDKLAVEGKYDIFYQLRKVYLLKDRKLYPLAGKNDLLISMYKNADQIRDFMKKSRIRTSEKEPESFIPVVRYYNSLNK